MRHNLVETLMGAVVLAAAGFFLAFAYTNADIRAINGYELRARFERIDGLPLGADVRLSGIKVGSVVGQELDKNTYQAIVRLSIDPSVRLPEDTFAKITSEGLLGDSYLALSPGASDVMLEPGDEIVDTQGAVDLLGLLSKFGSDSKSGDK
ncbi:MAG: outer membrane lipid asymmetry maintenance protein MlaD [Proteobacteria bacterium]|jgi:phospholipid/cholesterol/gamma-HCH transport system substrate-binding protein|nr:MAG: outer membrane lipid asymmetry maintenance protein MlaD [Pseudomonadota bacterium]